MPGKAHEVAIRGDNIGAVLVCLTLTVMSSEGKTDWEHFHSFGDMFGSYFFFFPTWQNLVFFILGQISVFFLLGLHTSFQFWRNFQREIVPSTYTRKYTAFQSK